MRINLIIADNGAGLTRDMHLMSRTLADAGLDISITALRRGKLRKWFRPWRVRAGNLWRRVCGRKPPFRLNLMQEHIRAEYLPWADRNVLVPHPEYLNEKDIALLGKMDCVFVKTGHAGEIFAGLGSRTEYIGFTSEDRYEGGVERRRAFLHVPGKSGNKGTGALLAAWKQHPHWPPLTIVQRSRRPAGSEEPLANVVLRTDYVPEQELREMQNAHRFHLCPSETEGYGHYLMEALSVGAVTLTTDGAPMNELVTAERGILIGVARTGRQAAAVTWLADPAGIAEAVERALALDEAQCDALGAAGRRFFLANDAAFRERLPAVVRGWL
ncbi:glycosyltransferase [Pseudoxanthomonas gei]|uniref:Glycosyltransferase n=1 Tax=Pseudoxanthomonas gei TaxID=1383030 RepID=A0ABX0ADY7_9GAMM|nr:glycosyltransferase [Pseudoxanthomonas gei]NDK39809.1 glycosyltransferase [Pseudoxanthomonas gei]